MHPLKAGRIARRQAVLMLAASSVLSVVLGFAVFLFLAVLQVHAFPDMQKVAALQQVQLVFIAMVLVGFPIACAAATWHTHKKTFLAALQMSDEDDQSGPSSSGRPHNPGERATRTAIVVGIGAIVVLGTLHILSLKVLEGGSGSAGSGFAAFAMFLWLQAFLNTWGIVIALLVWLTAVALSYLAAKHHNDLLWRDLEGKGRPTLHSQHDNRGRFR